MERLLYIAGGGVAILLAAFAGLNGIRNPMDVRSDLLNERIGQVSPTSGVETNTGEVDYAALQASIASKGNLWQPLTTPPKAPSQTPDLQTYLQDVSIARGQVGSGAGIKVRIVTRDNPSGQWIGIGDRFRGVLIKAIDQRSVVFSLTFEGKEYLYTLTR